MFAKNNESTQQVWHTDLLVFKEPFANIRLLQCCFKINQPYNFSYNQVQPMMNLKKIKATSNKLF